MNLLDGIFSVRNKLGELEPNLWSDYEITIELSTSARRMCSAAQYLQSFVTFNSTVDAAGNWAQEYILPLDVDQIIGAAYFSGVIFPLLPAPRESLQLGGKVGGIPWYFYVKKTTKVLTPQLQNATIALQPISPNIGQNSRTVIGLNPIPNSEIPIYIWYQQWHPDLKELTDEVQIPDRFKNGWIAYAVARCKEKESGYQEAQYWDAIHDKQTQEFIDYQITNGQEITPPIL